MATNIVTVSGMFGNGKTYFADSPVVIDISGLMWPTDGAGKPTSPFNIVRVEVYRTGEDTPAGDFRADTGGQSTVSFDISSALRAIWALYDFASEAAQAGRALSGTAQREYQRAMRSYFLRIYTEYMASDDGGVYTVTQCEDENHRKDIPGGQCLIGWLTEWERATIGAKENADASHWEGTGLRNGDASTKPASSPERIGSTSITSWTDVQSGYTRSVYYPASTQQQADQAAQHAPLALRDTYPYTDFLFVNRRGAVETCSSPTKEGMEIEVETKQHARIERPAFKPSRSLMAVASGGRRSWQMSSGPQTREWAEWWQLEFLMARQWWMLYKGSYVPVTVEPAKKSQQVYDRAKQQMAHVDFTVTLALEG